MKILTREEESDHYYETLKGGFLGGGIGLVLGTVGLYGAVSRYSAFRHMTLPLRAFLVTSSSTFGAIVTADHFSRGYEASRHPQTGYEDPSQRAKAIERENQTRYERMMAFGKEHRYQIVGGSWVLSMVAALAMTGRNPYLSTQQKLVQARVYAQGLTVAILIATAIFEIGDQNKGEGRWETVKILDPDDPDHHRLIDKKVHHERYEGEDQWKDMVEAEEQKMHQREEKLHEREEAHRKREAKKGKNGHKEGKKEEDGSQKNSEGGDKKEGEGEKKEQKGEEKKEDKKGGDSKK